MIGERIQLLRSNRNITQEQLATVLGVSKSTLSAYEREERQPSANVIIQIAKYFDVSSDFVLGLIRNEISLSTQIKDSEQLVVIPNSIMGDENKIKDYNMIHEILLKYFSNV